MIPQSIIGRLRASAKTTNHRAPGQQAKLHHAAHIQFPMEHYKRHGGRHGSENATGTKCFETLFDG